MTLHRAVPHGTGRARRRHRWTGPQAGGGIASLVGLLFVLPGIVALLPASTADAINTYLPLNAGFAVVTSTFENSHHLAPWAGIAGYAVLAVAATAIGPLRRDA